MVGRSAARAARVVLASAVAAASGCSEPLAFAAWTIPVPDGAPVRDYAHVDVSERDGRIALLEELVVGAGGTAPLYGPIDVAVADDGRMFVLGAGSHTIEAFDAAGGHVRSISREGQGPGEIRSGGEIAVAGDVLVRAGDGKLSVWTLNGAHLGDAATPFALSLEGLAGLPGGSLLAGYEQRNEDGTVDSVFAVVSQKGTILAELARIRGPQRNKTLIVEQGLTILRLPSPAPVAVSSRSGAVYLTNADEYQVLATAADGAVRWALRADAERLPMTEDDMAAAVLRDVGVPAEDLDAGWPAFNPALANGRGAEQALRVDGHGHLYVFPFGRECESGSCAVDVYSADGERLFAGWIDVPGWDDALGDRVYRLWQDPATEETVLAVYRLVEPF